MLVALIPSISCVVVALVVSSLSCFSVVIVENCVLVIVVVVEVVRSVDVIVQSALAVEIGILAVDVGGDSFLVVVWCSSVLVCCVVDALVIVVAACEVDSIGTVVV